MGTRNLTAVFLDGKYRIAQYGQWDGYPSGQGVICLEFARKVLANNHISRFIGKLHQCRYLNEEEIDEINARIDRGELRDWQRVYPELSRDTAANILNMVYESENGLKLRDNIEFAADSLFCEWAYVIDLDKGTFEVYQGFNQEPLEPTDRFYGLKPEPGHLQSTETYYPVRKIAEYRFTELPSDEEFCKLEAS